MTDDAYMPASERDPRFIDRAFTFDIAQSHAVLDSVAQELADSVDALFEAWPGAMDGQLFHKAVTALMRFDNLNKKAGAE